LATGLGAQTSTSFELRYYTPDAKANGETDFKGETSVFTTEECVQFLNRYAEVASKWFGDTAYNTEVVAEHEIQDALARLKPRPQPELRQSIPLTAWKYTGYRDGQEANAHLKQWLAHDGVELRDGTLRLPAGKALDYDFMPQAWRFHLTWKAKAVSTAAEVSFRLTDRSLVTAATVGFAGGERFFYTTADGQRVDTLAYEAGRWYTFSVEVDLSGGDSQLGYGRQVGRYNLYIDGDLVADFVPLERVVLEPDRFSSIGQVNRFSVDAGQDVALDELLGYGYALTNRLNYPYQPLLLVDENFEEKPAVDGWVTTAYDDSRWTAGELPVGIGSERHFQEELLLRKVVPVGTFGKAFLNLEVLDPGGEVWVNEQLVERIQDRYPHRLDISDYLNPETDNLIAIKVDPFYLRKGIGEMMTHSSLDFNVGWFCGRMSLDLTAPTHIEDVFVHTLTLRNRRAELKTKVSLASPGPFEGKAIVEIFPWFSQERKKAAARSEFAVRFTGSQAGEHRIEVPNPALWTPETPTLYKVKVTLVDKSGRKVDDYVTTTGIRTVDQQGGMFRLNGKPSMLNGAQIMGFRGPLDDAVTWNRCPPEEWIAKELLMVKKMNGNLLRIHVHAWENSPSEGINDPRFAEMADQMGIMLIWNTPSWTRTGDDWQQIDFDGFPHYMRQVFNHPSIVLWEASNHPNKFKRKTIDDSDAFCEKMYNTIHPVDSSRIISFTSFLKHLHYGDDDGTIDYRGNPIKATPAYTAPLVTRGNQDAPTGYSNDWATLRKWGQDRYMQSMLASKDRAYFNFEHQESMAQANWELLKGKPYYHVHSYEWNYDEGTIGRRLRLNEWKESQAWQAFGAWEAIKKMRWQGYDGFSWCSLHGGPNSGTYHKPIIDMHGHAKLAYWANKMAFQPTVAGSYNVDVAYGPDDKLTPVILHWGEKGKATLTIHIHDLAGTLTDEKTYRDIQLPDGREPIPLPAFKPAWNKEGYYIINYELTMEN
jgi:hypothetical protein